MEVLFWLITQASACFDGILFHNFMHDCRTKSNDVNVEDLTSKMQDLQVAATPRDAKVPAAKEKKASKAKKEAEVNASPPPPPATSSTALPADAYREQILQQIARDRVTIIHGETG